MPRVEVIIRVLSDDRSNLAQSMFQIGETATRVLTEEVSPMELAQDLGEIFTTSIHEQFPSIGFDTLPGELHVTSSPGLPESFRDVLQRRLEPFVRSPSTPAVRAAIRQEIEAFRAEYPDQILPEIDFAGMERRLLARGFRPDVSMGTSVHGAIEELYQAPEPQLGGNAASRRIRQALRAVVGEPGEPVPEQNQTLFDLYGAGRVSRRTLLEAFGLTETSTRQELEEALSRLSPNPEPPRGGRHLGAILDDAAYFPPTPGTYAPQIIGDSHLARDLRGRHQARIESFQAIYGGDPERRSSGIEPPFQPEPQPRARVGGDKPPEDRTAIPTRYQRKPVI